jgi:hypothetical protein
VPDPLGKIPKTTQKVLPGVTLGIFVPSDVSSLLDIFPCNISGFSYFIDTRCWFSVLQKRPFFRGKVSLDLLP